MGLLRAAEPSPTWQRWATLLEPSIHLSGLCLIVLCSSTHQVQLTPVLGCTRKCLQLIRTKMESELFSNIKNIFPLGRPVQPLFRRRFVEPLHLYFKLLHTTNSWMLAQGELITLKLSVSRHWTFPSASCWGLERWPWFLLSCPWSRILSTCEFISQGMLSYVIDE